MGGGCFRLEVRGSEALGEQTGPRPSSHTLATVFHPAVGSAGPMRRSLFCPNTVISVEPLPGGSEECELKVAPFISCTSTASIPRNRMEEKKSHIAQVHGFQIWQELPQV